MNPYSTNEIISALQEMNSHVRRQFSSIAAEEFFKRRHENWSYGEILLHLIKANSGVSKGLKMPRAALSLMFGKSETTSRDYVTVRDDYLKKIAEGAKATGEFVPSIDENPASKESEKEKLLSKWDEISGRLPGAIQSWDESDLDVYRMPHPILGKLTVREMLLFTIYHNQHHLPFKLDAKTT